MGHRLCVRNAVPMMPRMAMDAPINIEIEQGCTLCVIGPNGAGKSILTSILTGDCPIREGGVTIDGSSVTHGDIITLSFRDIYSAAQLRDMYYQQRFNSFNSDESPMVAEVLEEYAGALYGRMADVCGIEDMLDKRTIALSSGQTRKLHIYRAVMKKPKYLIIENPFIGLDSASREQVGEMLAVLPSMGIVCMYAVSDVEDIPYDATHVLPVKERHIFPVQEKDVFMKDTLFIHSLFQNVEKSYDVFPSPLYDLPSYDVAVEMKDVGVSYGGREILRDVNWTVRVGEKWSLTGGNGSGKSTLLSLICGDNPQAYANDITLFDRRRGTGESIWDIKKRIGYVSPEMHTCYMEDIKCIEVVASGLYDTIGLFRRPTAEHLSLSREWLAVFGAEALAEKPFLSTSFGEQRLVLLVRAFVKNPQLLILDEPFHGLDSVCKARVQMIIEDFCTQKDKTLIMVSHYERDIPSCVTLNKRL
ncbi:MAG: ATP-binding cassette domain-containing protein [Flavobacteriales bacterium]|nr:ATP-binding cassette domain-containing protein [Flavobacteriales bacterium]